MSGEKKRDLVLVALSRREGYGVVTTGGSMFVVGLGENRTQPQPVNDLQLRRLSEADLGLRSLDPAARFETIGALSQFLNLSRDMAWSAEAVADLLSGRLDSPETRDIVMLGLVDVGERTGLEHIDAIGLVSGTEPDYLLPTWEEAIRYGSRSVVGLLARVTALAAYHASPRPDAELLAVRHTLLTTELKPLRTPGLASLLRILAWVDGDETAEEVARAEVQAELHHRGSIQVLTPIGVSVGWARSALPPPRLAIREAVRRLLHGRGLRVGGGLFDALDRVVDDLLVQAIDRTQKNGRKTVLPEDL